MKESNNILEVRNLTVHYYKNGKKFIAVNNISFVLEKGEIISILGESGSGKSSLAKGLIGILPVSTSINGKIKVFPEITFNLGEKGEEWEKVRAKKIGYIFQDSQQALNPMMKIKDQFKERLLQHKIVHENEVYNLSKKYLEYLNFKDAEKILDSYPFELSGGMCQRVCIALCLCLNPEILIADEITSALDVLNQIEIINLLKRIKKDLGLSVIFITHDIALASLIADKVIVMNKGMIQDEGKVQDIFQKPKSLYTRELIQSRKEILNLKSKKIENNIEKPLLEVKNIYKKYKGNQHDTLKEISFSINEGEIVGILGESGAGKSTLVKCIMGIEKVDSGEILFGGEKIDSVGKREKRKLYKNIQMIFQEARNCLNPRRKAKELIYEPQKYMRLYSRLEAEKNRENLLTEVGVDSIHFNSIPPQLSTGQCQRLAIARALMIRPRLLICDEAVSALDVNTQLQILQLLLRIQEKHNVALLMISHDIQLLKGICNRVIVLEEGAICETIEKNEQGILKKPLINRRVNDLFQLANKIERNFFEKEFFYSK